MIHPWYVILTVCFLFIDFTVDLLRGFFEFYTDTVDLNEVALLTREATAISLEDHQKFPGYEKISVCWFAFSQHSLVFSPYL